ncbi:MAG: TIGR02147 family protein [Bdellovibrionia bacterium]
MSEVEIVKILKEELLRSKTKNPNYSVRSFAKRLKSSPSVVSEILNGKRNLTYKNGSKFLEALAVSPLQKDKLLKGLVLKRRSLAGASSQENYQLIEESAQFDVIANWYYFAILSLAETKTFKSDVEWIAQRLRIKKYEAEHAIRTLVKLGLLNETKNGKLETTGAQFRTSTDIPNAAVKKNHFDHLELLRQSLENDDMSVRDFSAMTLTFDPAKMDEAKKLIRDFRRQFTKLMETEETQEVYRLSIQLIPLSHGVAK